MFKNKYVIKDNIVEIYLNRKLKPPLICIIDKDDLQRIIEYNITWFPRFNYSNKIYMVSGNAYLGKINGKNKYSTINLQTFLLGTRYWGKKHGIVVDHYDHDTMNNRKDNLRIISNLQNSRYRKAKNLNNTSGYRNVCWDNSRKKWIVQLQVNGKNTVLGEFNEDELSLAGCFAEKMRQELYNDFAGNN